MCRRIFSLIIALCLIVNQTGIAQAVTANLNLAGQFARMSNGLVRDTFRPPHIRFFSYDNLRDNLRIMLDKGDIKEFKNGQVEKVAQELLNYFLIGVSLPNDAFWVNLRPDSENNIIENLLAKTDVGKIMLEADLQLKKDTARFTSPQTPEGKVYWQRLYKKAEQLYGHQQATIPTLTRPWIVPNEIIVRETANSAYIYKATLKVMLEQDFIRNSSLYNFKDEKSKAINDYSSQLIRELILPKLTKELNLSQRYATLRQVYYSIILSRWFKSRFTGQSGQYASRINSRNLSGLTSNAPWSKSEYFNAYKKSFQQGEYNEKEVVYTPTGQMVRAYFSGGADLTAKAMTINGAAITGGTDDNIERSLRNSGLIDPNIGKNGSGGLAAKPPLDYKTIDDIDVNNKIMLVRPDLNVPAERGKIKGDKPYTRIIEAAKTLKALAERKAKVVVIFHQGRPNDPAFMDTPDQHAAQLSQVMGLPVKTVNDLFGQEAIQAIKDLKPGEILVLKPVRAADPTNPGKTLEDNAYFVPTFRSIIDYFVLDGFSVAHRDSPSVTGFKGVPTVAGKLMDSELKGAVQLRTPTDPYLVVIGGGKVVEKVPSIISEVQKYGANKVLVGGKAANLLLVAANPEAINAKTIQEQREVAKKVIGEAGAADLEREYFSIQEKQKLTKEKDRLPSLSELARFLQINRNKIELPLDMVFIYKDGNKQVVQLTNGRVPEFFSYLLSGIGPQTAKHYAEIASRTEQPFQSAFVLGPLSDTRYPALLAETRQVLEAVARVPFWSTGGGDTEAMVTDLGLTPTYTSLAGGALGEFKRGDTLPGIELLADNKPEKVQGKLFVPTTNAEAHTQSHIAVLSPLVKAIALAGGKLVARTMVFGRGGKVGVIAVKSTDMSRVIRESIEKISIQARQAIPYLETIEVDLQNPWLDYSVTTLRTTDGKPINVDAVRQILAADPSVASFLIPAEIDKKGKMGTPGKIDIMKLEEKLNKQLTLELSRRGISFDNLDAELSSKPLPAFAQVTESSNKGELKLTIFVPTPNSDIGRLMRLAQDAGINLKNLIENIMPIPEVTGQGALLGEAPKVTLPVKKEKAVEPKKESPLAGLEFGRAEINEDTQSIIYSGHENEAYNFNNDFFDIVRRVAKTGQFVRLMVPAGGKLENDILYLAKGKTPPVPENVSITSHPLKRDNRAYTEFIIQPKVNLVIVGAGNECWKVYPALRASGLGTPAVAIFSLARSERVVHLFEGGGDVYIADKFDVSKETGESVRVYDEATELQKFESALLSLLTDAYISQARNRILASIPESQRIAQMDEIEVKARAQGQEEAQRRFNDQYKGLLSKAMIAGKFDVVIDATPEGSGATNKKNLYEPALKANPKMKFIYQGGEKKGVADASFSALTANFDDVVDLTHLRHVSCNTTGLSSIVMAILDTFGVPLVIDNSAVRRVVDPGDIKSAPGVSVLYDAAYHHGPDVLTVTPSDDVELISGINTDAAQSGATTTFHYHILSLRRADGQRFDVNKVKQVLGAMSRVALVDFPAGVFDAARITEIMHNQLPQWGAWIPIGANHPLVPIATVQATDDPSEVRIVYAVPQESIVAPGNVNAVHAVLGMGSKDASLALVNDALGIPELVEALETRLPVGAINRVAVTNVQLGSNAYVARDSRGRETVEVTLKVGDLEAKGDVPAGASTGRDEAQTVSVAEAIKNIQEKIIPLLNKSGYDLSTHEGLTAMERLLINEAGPNFAKLGANAVVPVSRALWKLAAKLQGLELYEYIQKYEPEAIADKEAPVYFYMNIFNGGLHALKVKEGEVLGKDRIDIQEIMIVPVSAKSHAEALAMGDKIDDALKWLLLSKLLVPASAITRADEAGFSVKGLGDSSEAISLVFEAIKKAGYQPGKDVKLALDVAASSFLENEQYLFRGKKLSSQEMVDYYVALAKQYDGMIISIEDGLAEDDWQGWQLLTKEMKKLGIRTIGDDIFVTQLGRLEKGIAEEAATDILIKVNQNGIMTGTLDVIKRAKQAGMGWVVSHRSGETLDDSIADLAFATNAMGLKTGDPQPDYDFGPKGEYAGQPLVRRVKYLRMVEIEKKETSGNTGATASDTGTSKSTVGGIDFRVNAMQITYQPMGNFARLNFKLPNLSRQELESFDIEAELSRIENMVENKILPSGQRLKEILAACRQKGDLDSMRERITVILVKMGMLEEGQWCLQEGSKDYKEALVLIDSLHS